MKTYQANLINGLTLIFMPIWAYLTYEGTAEKPEQSITALIPLFLGVILFYVIMVLRRKIKLLLILLLLLHLLHY